MNTTQNTAIILSTEAFAEKDTLVTLFCEQTGRRRGLVKGRKQAATLQPLDEVAYTHTRRLPTQLGTLTLELTKSRAALWMNGAADVLATNWLRELLEKTLPEEESHPVLATHIRFLLEGPWPPTWQQAAETERLFLHELGYSLQLDANPVREGKSDTTPLMYTSPKSGRAVSQQAGQPYHAQLLPLPSIWGGIPYDSSLDATFAHRLTTHFLTHVTHGKDLKARHFFWQNLLNSPPSTPT